MTVKRQTLLIFLLHVQLALADAAALPMADRVRMWKGERVVFTSEYCDASNKLTTEISGKTGSILDAQWEGGHLRVAVQRDDTQAAVTLTSVGCLAFMSEKNALGALVGRKLWTKGFLWDAAGTLPPLTKLVVREVEMGTDHNVLSLSFDTQDGRTVHIPFRVPVRPCVLATFCDSPDDEPWKVEKEFFESDPKLQHPSWSPDTWRVIAKGMVAVGMTEAMVRVACGRYLTETGAVLSPTGKASPTYACNGYDFTITNGKVVQSRKTDR